MQNSTRPDQHIALLSATRLTFSTQCDAAFNVNINAVWTEDEPDADEHVAWARAYFDAMQEHASGRAYVNFLGDEGADRVREA